MNMFSDKLSKTLILLIPLCIGAILILLDFGPTGTLQIEYDFSGATPYISELSPDGRVLDIEQTETGEYFQPMVIEPVYFDVRLPQTFEKTRAEILYQKLEETPLKLGFRTSGDDWSWHIEDIVPVERVGDLTRGVAEFDTSGAYLDERNLRFIISSPGLGDSGESVRIHKINLEFEKENKLIGKRIKEYLASWI